MMVGYRPQDGDRIAVIEDVVTAGTAVKESIQLFKQVADVRMEALFVSVDRMEQREPGVHHLARTAGGLWHPSVPHRHHPRDYPIPAQSAGGGQGVH